MEDTQYIYFVGMRLIFFNIKYEIVIKE